MDLASESLVCVTLIGSKVVGCGRKQELAYPASKCNDIY